MITALTLKNFKCFEDLELPLKPLTVFSGFNAAGKSTAVQGLLLIAQTLRTDASLSQIPLNGTCVELGTPGDVIRDGGREGRELQIGFDDAYLSFRWILLADDRTRGLALRTQAITVTPAGQAPVSFDTLAQIVEPAMQAPERIRQSVACLKQLVAIGAVRPVTSDVFPSPQDGVPIHANVGLQGQYASWWFNQMSDDEVDADRCHELDTARTLRRQFSAWAGTLFPGAQANVQQLAKTGFSRLELRIGDTEDWRRPINIGYGLSYAFPILVAGLLAKKGQLLVIDSPEAHLHPAAQSAVGQFLARMAQSGVQILVETHSDHVINGMRVAVRQGFIQHDELVFHFFARQGDDLPKTSLEVIAVDANGRMSAWPTGFFDQIEKDLALL